MRLEKGFGQETTRVMDLMRISYNDGWVSMACVEKQNEMEQQRTSKLMVILRIERACGYPKA